MIEISHLTKKYGANVAGNDLSLTLEPGNIYGFLGPNGAGKSTTMNIITGYIGASSGEVKINGYDINKNPEEAKKCIGYLPEIPPVYGDMKVLEYLKFVAELKKLDSHTRNADIRQVMDLTKLHEMKDRLIRNLSKGYRQRVGLAQALLGMPEIIILDEPTVGLDPKQIIEIRDLIRSALRMRPERIVVGEVRGAEALDMLQAMNTGHDGSLSTGHANSTRDMLSRLETMVLQGNDGLPLPAIRQQISSALDIIIHLSRLRDKSRRTMEITEVLGYENGEIQLNPLFVFKETEGSTLEKVEGHLVRTGNPLRNDYKLRLQGVSSRI